MPLAFGAAVTGALLRAMTFMIVASPCAVVPATMLLLSAIANVGRHGVPVKSAVIMERLGQVNAVELDKTDNRSLELPAVENFTSAPGIGEPSRLTARKSRSVLRPGRLTRLAQDLLRLWASAPAMASASDSPTAMARPSALAM